MPFTIVPTIKNNGAVAGSHIVGTAIGGPGDGPFTVYTAPANGYAILTKTINVTLLGGSFTQDFIMKTNGVENLHRGASLGISTLSNVIVGPGQTVTVQLDNDTGGDRGTGSISGTEFVNSFPVAIEGKRVIKAYAKINSAISANHALNNLNTGPFTLYSNASGKTSLINAVLNITSLAGGGPAPVWAIKVNGSTVLSGSAVGLFVLTNISVPTGQSVTCDLTGSTGGLDIGNAYINGVQFSGGNT